MFTNFNRINKYALYNESLSFLLRTQIKRLLIYYIRRLIFNYHQHRGRRFVDNWLEKSTNRNRVKKFIAFECNSLTNSTDI